MFDIYFFESFSEEEEELKKYLPKEINAYFTKNTIQEENLKEVPAKIISIRTQSKIPIKWEEHLQAVLTRSTGYDHLINLKDRIDCGYLPKYCARAVAEHAIMLLFSLSRLLKKQIKNFDSFQRDNITGREVLNKNLVIFGIGNIGSEIYKLSKGIGMNVYGVDIKEKQPNLIYISKEKALEIADIIICSMNLTKDNINYFDYETLKKTKKNLIFINIARGEFSPTKDLLKLLNDEPLRSIGLDTYNDESTIAQKIRIHGIKNKELKEYYELSQKDNAILTPHNAFNTKESVENKSKQSVKQCISYLKDKKFIWKI